MTDAVEWKCPACKLSSAECACSEDVIAEAQSRLDAGADAVVDASNPTQVAARAKAAKRDANRDKDDLNWMMRHEQGRRIMWRLLESCGVFNNAAVMGAYQSNETMFKCGEQNIGLYYTAKIISQEPDGYNLMVKENSGRLT